MHQVLLHYYLLRLSVNFFMEYCYILVVALFHETICLFLIPTQLYFLGLNKPPTANVKYAKLSSMKRESIIHT